MRLIASRERRNGAAARRRHSAAVRPGHGTAVRVGQGAAVRPGHGTAVRLGQGAVVRRGHGAAVIAAAGAAVVSTAAALPALAFPDGAPWEVAGRDGCAECHFDAPPEESSAALAILGLPGEPTPGERYPLTVRLEDERMVTAGFLLSAWRDAERTSEAGTFEADDTAASSVETNGARARSTVDGLAPSAPGVAEWSLIWRAPEHIDAPIELEVWANAGNDDKSPFGDATHVRRFRLGGEDQPGLTSPAAANPERSSSRSSRISE